MIRQCCGTCFYWSDTLARSIGCGPVDLRNVGGQRVDYHNALTGDWEDDNDATGSSTSVGETARPDWVICGDESGPGARNHLDRGQWLRQIIEQCAAADVPFFGKQRCENGRKIPFDQWPERFQVRQFPEVR